MYLRYSEEFRATAQSMINNARRKNTDGVTVDYVQMTMACVNCHKFMRREPAPGGIPLKP